MNLNPQQAKAVQLTESTVRIVAGAGSGKTSVLANRYAFLVNDLGIAASNILCMTFTNKAAAEMRRRITPMVGRGDVNDFICTLHGFCAKFLRQEIYRIGWPKNFSILDGEDAKLLARQAMQEYGVDRRKTTAERFLAKIGKLKGADSEGYIIHHFLPPGPENAPDVEDRYMQLQLKSYALDYDDLMYFTLYILRHFPDAADVWLDRLNYIMVDEGQDCSPDDWRLIRTLAKGHGNLFVVGDPDQAIYEWRGAAPHLFTEWKAEETVILNHNYRSTPQILRAANAIIANNKERIPKDLFSTLPDGAKPLHIHTPSRRAEADDIVKRIADSAGSSSDYSKTAVLYRASYLSAELERALVKAKIPYTVWGGVRFFERREIKDVLAYLKLLDSSDDLAFSRIVNVPPRRFGKASMEKLQRLAEADDLPLYDTLVRHIGSKPFNTEPLRKFVAMVEHGRLMATGPARVSDLADHIMRTTGYTDMLRRDEAEERLENVAELLNSIKDYERDAFDEPNPLAAYLQDVAIFSRESHDRREAAVRLMTIHQAKGLEFDTVFIVGLTEGVFPSHRTIRERLRHGEEEERRLMYVAVTRAKQRLFLCESEGFASDTGALQYPSRFLTEIPDDAINRVGLEAGTDLFDHTRRQVEILNREVYGIEDHGSPRFPDGTPVMHRVFGQGIVEAYDPATDSYRVRFAAGSRNLVARVLTPLH